MFDPEKEVPSFELCKRLKKIGYPQGGGGWYWDNKGKEIIYFKPGTVVQRKNKVYLHTSCLDLEYTNLIIKAPTVAEMGEWLPNTYSSSFAVRFLSDNNGRKFYRLVLSDYWFDDYSEANARAKMLIWLIENGHVTFKSNKDSK